MAKALTAYKDRTPNSAQYLQSKSFLQIFNFDIFKNLLSIKTSLSIYFLVKYDKEIY
jgi:hypothetical protein